MTLAALQTRFQTAILSEDRTILADINTSQQLTSEARFGIYADAYHLRLAGFLAEDFKVLHSAIGDETFDALREAYIGATPSRHRNARWYARDLPDFMQANPPWNASRILIDFARLERALADAFDAADAAACTVATLAALAPEQWPQMRFSFHPSAEVLRLAKGIAAAFEAAAAETPCPPPDQAQDEILLVWRNRDAQTLYRALEPGEALAIREAIAGKSFGEICTLLQFSDAADSETIAGRAAAYLAQWFTDGLIIAVCDEPIVWR
ncbi:DNA-binding domain-containing protein [uncultured Methylovirgula sp.]|uniref:HvfC/BufC N-terminal domain-containing protein n=1 Tax=uncultured Methylovirgula sp. TaxID=1285960 RepID=UPI00262E010C|nr:DNA-binding domain-containing protein [uncultured Methylovirgula sp.]